jgi:two-component system OmpR family response regulator
MPKVLSVEDDELMIHEILSSLSGSGYEVDVARCGRDGIAKVMAFPYDLVTLDRTLPDLDGLTILSTMRDAGIDTPVLLVSSMSNVDERVRGLRAGGDDYLTKPFAREEMVARAEVLLRRKTQVLTAETRLQVGELALDLLKRKASHHGEALDLQPTEFKLLEYMMRHPGPHDDSGRRLGLPLRPGHQPDRCSCGALAQEGGRGGRGPADPYR